MSLVDQLGLRHRIVQVGMGGGIAGEIADAQDVARALEAGAHAVVAGTRFLARLPMSVGARTHRRQRPEIPLLGPIAPPRGMPDELVQASALYAGATALRIESLLPAARVVAELAGAAGAPKSPTISSS